jgi:aldose 1-epimerase
MPSSLNSSILTISQQEFGTLSNGEVAQLFTLENSTGITVNITNFGAIIVSLFTPDKDDRYDDIVLGYDNVRGYEQDPYYLGAIIGRYAGRIDQGKLTIDNSDYQLSINNNDNQLHGGPQALNKQLWQATTQQNDKKVSLVLTHTSPDGDNGFPGEVKFKVIYSLSHANELTVEYFASTNKPTVVNLTQHSYFNLAGHNSGNIYQQEVQLNAEYFLPMNELIYPTGEIRAVSNTAHDFTSLHSLGAHINSNDAQVVIAKGYDNYWLMNDEAITMKKMAATAWEPNSGRTLIMYSDQPCLILYTANYIDGSQQGKDDTYYQKHGAFCLEPQRLANKIDGAQISNTLLYPAQPFYSQSRFVFDVKT